MDVAAADAVFLLRQHHDGTSLGGLVGKRSELCCVGKLFLGDAAHRQEGGSLAVAEGDGAGLVEEQGIDVAGRLHRAPRHRKHVETHEPVHAGDADGGKQGADRGRNERHEQRHHHHDGDHPPGVACIARDRNRGEDEDDRHAGEQDVERDLVRCLLALGALDERNHAVEEGRALRCGDAHLEPVGDHQRAAGDGRAVAAGLANDRRRLTGDGRLIDRGDAFDHLAVGGDQIAGLDQDHLSWRKLARWNRHGEPSLLIHDELGFRLFAGLAQRCRLRLAASLGHGLGEIGEQHREPQPENDLEGEAEMLAAVDPFTDKDDGGKRGDHLDHEHHRVFHHDARIELGKGRADRRQDDLGIGERRHRHPLAQTRRFHRNDSEVRSIRTVDPPSWRSARRSVQARAPGRKRDRRR